MVKSLAEFLEFRFHLPVLGERAALLWFDRVDAAQIVFCEEDAGTVGSVAQNQAFPVWCDTGVTMSELLFAKLQESSDIGAGCGVEPDNAGPAAAGSALSAMEDSFRHKSGLALLDRA